jgi:diphosphomevalonate decarboxylase
MTDPIQHIQSLLPPHNTLRGTGEAYAPANIALCKYWGKRDARLKLPVTGSLSVSLGSHGTRMTLRRAETDALTLNGETIDPGSKTFRRLFEFLDLLRDPAHRLTIESHNTIPIAAGLASSASAFAAAVKAVEALYGWNLAPALRSILARLGSGSASRSVFEGFVEWHAGTAADGMDSFAEPVAPVWPDFRIGILTVSDAPKPVGSTEAMERTVRTAPLYTAWPQQVAHDLPRIRRAVLEHDFTTLGETAEHNALAMHATMIASRPPVLYWLPETTAHLHTVHRLRAEGLPVYATLDAGPNIKLLYTAEHEAGLKTEFPNLIQIEQS